MIKVRSLFYGWRKATEEQARGLVNHIYQHSGLSGQRLISYLHTRVRGIDPESLIEREKYVSPNKCI